MINFKNKMYLVVVFLCWGKNLRLNKARLGINRTTKSYEQ